MYEHLNTDSEKERCTTLFKYIKIKILAIGKTKNRTLQIKITERSNPQSREKKWDASN